MENMLFLAQIFALNIYYNYIKYLYVIDNQFIINHKLANFIYSWSHRLNISC
jgi:hypothetical protein